MTLKKNGQWSLSRLALLATIVGGIAMCVEATPTAIDYIKKAFAPWVEFPDQIKLITETQQLILNGQATTQTAIASVQSDVKEIKTDLIGVKKQINPSAPPHQQNTALITSNAVVEMESFQ